MTALREFHNLRETLYSSRLPNGLPVFVINKPGYRKTYAFFAANYGSVDTRYSANGAWRETPSGVAHFLEHKLFDMPDGANVLQVFAQNGASPNAFTSHAMTAYHFECTERFEDNLRLLLRFVSTPYFTAESVQKEQGIIGQEIRMVEDDPCSRVYENMLRGLYARHPVRESIVGTTNSIAGIDAAVLYDCHAAFYHPGNMCLCVAGDVEPERVAAVAAEELPEAPSAQIRRDYGREGSHPLQPDVSQSMEVALPLFALGATVRPPAGGIDTLRFELLADLAAEVLTGRSSPLYHALYEKGLINRGYDCGAFLFPGGACLLALGESADPAAVREALLREAGRLTAEGVDEGLFSRLKRALLGARLRQLDAPEALCRLQAAAHFAGACYLEFPTLFDSLTPDAVLTLLGETFAPGRTTLSTVVPIS